MDGGRAGQGRACCQLAQQPHHAQTTHATQQTQEHRNPPMDKMSFTKTVLYFGQKPFRLPAQGNSRIVLFIELSFPVLWRGAGRGGAERDAASLHCYIPQPPSNARHTRQSKSKQRSKQAVSSQAKPSQAKPQAILSHSLHTNDPEDAKPTGRRKGQSRKQIHISETPW